MINRKLLIGSAMALGLMAAPSIAGSPWNDPPSSDPSTEISGQAAQGYDVTQQDHSSSTDVDVDLSNMLNGSFNTDKTVTVTKTSTDNSQTDITKNTDISKTSDTNKFNGNTVSVDSNKFNGNSVTSDSNKFNGNNTIVASQELKAVNPNSAGSLPMLTSYNGNGNGHDHDDPAAVSLSFSSGHNEVSGSAFAAYSGILNSAWNTGIDTNAQAATNIAAQGTVTFGGN